MPPNRTLVAPHTVYLPRPESLELKRLAAERRVSVHALLLAQIDPLRAELVRRVKARQAAERT